MPIILAIETSSELASCALLSGDTLITRASSGVRTHSQSILPMVQEVLAEAGVKLNDCAAIAFGAGPGSFTGVRTACGIAQGLAFGAGLPAVPVVTLASAPLAACGNGFSAYAEAFAGRAFASGALAGLMPHAGQVAQLARIELALGRGVKAAEAQPLYLRNKIAFTSAERQAINAAKAAA
jgi:tRNA threonylcarbamoyladenosine biosynthesis protein TsaB